MEYASIYTMLVTLEQHTKMESILNKLRIPLGHWDVSKVFKVAPEVKLVNYTIYCTEMQFKSITNLMDGTRVY